MVFEPRDSICCAKALFKPWVIETMKVSVTTPMATPRMVSADRSLFALTVETAIAADSFMSSKLILKYRGLSTEWRAAFNSVLSPQSFLFRAKRLNRVELRSLPRGPEAARDSDGRGDGDAQDRRKYVEKQREAHRLRQHEGEPEARADAEHAAYRSYDDGLYKELKQHVASRRAHGLAYAYLARALGHRDEHDVHHDDASDDE